jgi:hypothetical protein
VNALSPLRHPYACDTVHDLDWRLLSPPAWVRLGGCVASRQSAAETTR